MREKEREREREKERERLCAFLFNRLQDYEKKSRRFSKEQYFVRTSWRNEETQRKYLVEEYIK